MINALLTYEFLQNAFLSGIIVGVIAPLLGLFIVVRRLALIADALSHVALAGIAGSLFLSQQVLFFSALNPVYLGIASAVGGSLLIEKLRSVYKHYEELAIPVILSAGIGFGAIFISLSQGFSADLIGYLFGSVSAVSRQDLIIVVVIAIIVIGYIRLLYKELFVLSFDSEYSKVSGIKARFIQLFFMVIIALVIGASMRVVGILLVSSLMTVPVAAAMQIAKSFKGAMIYSIIFGEIAVIIGLFSAFHLNIAPGGTIVVTSILLLLLVLSWKKIRSNRKTVSVVEGELV